MVKMRKGVSFNRIEDKDSSLIVLHFHSILK